MRVSIDEKFSSGFYIVNWDIAVPAENRATATLKCERIGKDTKLPSAVFSDHRNWSMRGEDVDSHWLLPQSL